MDKLRPPGTEMGILEILARVRELTESWAQMTNSHCGNPDKDIFRLSRQAYFDFKRLQTDIEKSLEEQGDSMWKEHLNAQEAKKEKQ